MSNNFGPTSQMTTTSALEHFQRSYHKFGSLNESCTQFEKPFGKVAAEQSNGRPSGQTRDPTLLPFQCQTSNSRTGNIYANSGSHVFSRPDSACSDRFSSVNRTAGQSSLNPFNDHLLKSFDSVSGSGGDGRDDNSNNNDISCSSMSAYSNCLSLKQQQQIQKQQLKQPHRLDGESPELLISSDSSSSSRSSTASGGESGTSSSTSSREFTTRLLPLVSNEMFNVCTQIGAHTRSDRSQFGVLDPVGTFGGGLNRLNSFVYGDHTQLDMGPFKSKDSEYVSTFVRHICSHNC